MGYTKWVYPWGYTKRRRGNERRGNEKIFIADLCKKGCPWVTVGQKQKIYIFFSIFAFAADKGLYTTGGVIHEAL